MLLCRSTLNFCRSFSRAPRLCAERELFRFDHRNEFVSIPQVWLSTLEDLDSSPTGIMNLHPDVFRATPRIDLLHENITWQRTYRNLQLTKQLSRAEMPGGGRKPWPQKKMGRHHAGSIRAPGFVHGGFAHGVRGPRTWFFMLPISTRLHGLCTALSIKHAQNDLVVVEDFKSLTSKEGQFLIDLAETKNWGYSVLFIDVDPNENQNLVDATSQVPSFTFLPVHGLNCFSILKHETLVLSKAAVELLEESILTRLHSRISLQTKYQYKDLKQKILDESEHEEDPKYTPYV